MLSSYTGILVYFSSLNKDITSSRLASTGRATISVLWDFLLVFLYGPLFFSNVNHHSNLFLGDLFLVRIGVNSEKSDYQIG